MKNGLIILGLMLMGCEAQVDVDSNDVRADLIDVFSQDLKEPKCPNDHTDSIIPIIYGYPGEELLGKSDSGLAVIGGCEMMDEHYCKIHKISF
jgi:hypothetical protein